MKTNLLRTWSALWYLLAVKRRGCVEAQRVILPQKPKRKPFDWAKWHPIDMTPVPERRGNTAEFRAKIQTLRRADG